MPGKPGLASIKGEAFLDSPQMRTLLLSHIRDGKSRKEACAIIDIAPSTLFRYTQKHPEFLAEIQDAEADTIEPAYKVLEEIMLNEELSADDRISAADKLIRHRGRDGKNDHKVIEHQHKHVLEVGGDQLNEVLEIQRKLEERRAIEAATIEGTVIEEGNNHDHQ